MNKSRDPKVKQLASVLATIGFDRRERLAIIALLEGNTVRAASRAAGYHPRTLANKLTATTKAGDFRARFVRLVDAAGFDAAWMAEKMTQLLESKRPVYHPAAGHFELYADGNVQLRALALLARLRGAFPEKGEPHARVHLVVHTNLGTPTPERERTRAAPHLSTRWAARANAQVPLQNRRP
jgi:hypothetical protein